MTRNSCVSYFYVISGEGGEGCVCGTAALTFPGTGLGKEHGPAEVGATSV